MIQEQGLLEAATSLSRLFQQRFLQLKEKCPLIEEVRVLGLMIGIELGAEGAPAVQACFERGLLVNCTQGNVLRLLPALNLSPQQAEEGCDILEDVLVRLAEQAA